jgi:hypothetical protein
MLARKFLASEREDSVFSRFDVLIFIRSPGMADSLKGTCFPGAPVAWQTPSTFFPSSETKVASRKSAIVKPRTCELGEPELNDHYPFMGDWLAKIKFQFSSVQLVTLEHIISGLNRPVPVKVRTNKQTYRKHTVTYRGWLVKAKCCEHTRYR